MTRSKHSPTLKNVVLMGYYHTPRGMRKTMICHTVTLMILFIIYLYWNGGLVPWFLVETFNGKIQSKSSASLVDSFPKTEGDGSIVKWGHATNAKSSLLKAAEDSTIMMLEGDIELKGQGTDNQQLLPVMVHHTEVEGDEEALTFEEWLKIAISSQKGIKLDFKTIEPVEIALQHLSSKKSQINKAVHISGDILIGPNGEASEYKALDAARFLRLVTSYFPDSTIVVGWTASSAGDNGKTLRYSWEMVKEMFDTLYSRTIQQPLCISVHALFVKNSLSQLKWLVDILDLQMVVYSLETETINTNDLLFVRHKFPMESVYYDLHNKLSTSFDESKDNPASIAKEMIKSNFVFQADNWSVIKSDNSVIYLGTESVVMQKGVLVYKNDPYVFTNEPLKLRGRLEFFYISIDTNTYKSTPLEIFLHASNNIGYDNIAGLRLAISFDGRVTLGAYGYKESTNIQSDSIIIDGKTFCFSFEITEVSGKSISADIWRPFNCDNLNSSNSSSFMGRTTINLLGIVPAHKHIAIRSTMTNGFVAIDNFVISSS